MKAYRVLTLFSVVYILCVLSGCFGNKAPERSYFSVDYTLSTQPRHEVPKYHATVVIQGITSALAYDRQEIVYRANPYEFQYYWYRLWASKPRKMLNELILGHLQYTNLFTNVSSTIEDRLPDYLLDVYIESIEELDMSEVEWYAHLSLKFTMTRSEDSSVVWTYAFDAKRPVASNSPVYVVKAMSELLDSELVKAFEDLDRRLSSRGMTTSERWQERAVPVSSQTADELRSIAQPDMDFTEDTAENVPSATLRNKP